LDDVTVLQDRNAIRKISRRVLLNRARDQLAVLCGHTDWEAWEVSNMAAGNELATRNAMLSEAETILQSSSLAVSECWRDIGRDRSTLSLLVHNTSGDFLTENAIAGSILDNITEGSGTVMVRSQYTVVYNSKQSLADVGYLLMSSAYIYVPARYC